MVNAKKKAAKWYWYIFITVFSIQLALTILSLNFDSVANTVGFFGAVVLPGILSALSIFIFIYLLAKRFESKTLLLPIISILMGLSFLFPAVLSIALKGAIFAFIGFCIALFFTWQE